VNPRKKAFLLPIAKKLQAKLIGRATKAEICLKSMLLRSGIPFKFQHIIFTYDNFFIADFIVENKKGKRYLIELDGGVHYSWKARKKDRNRSNKIRQSGYGVLRFDNNDILTKPEKVAKKLKRYGII
jgi:very-short-patch-repair endonuclease